MNMDFGILCGSNPKLLARPMLEEYAIDELIDPCLVNRYSEQEVVCMLHAASLCIQRDPQARPKTSQVLRILEGDLVMEANFTSFPGGDIGSRSGRLWSEQQRGHKPHARSNSFGGEQQSYDPPRTDRGEKAAFLRR